MTYMLLNSILFIGRKQGTSQSKDRGPPSFIVAESTLCDAKRCTHNPVFSPFFMICCHLSLIEHLCVLTVVKSEVGDRTATHLHKYPHTGLKGNNSYNKKEEV
jgi:hypothetical protein